ncbi:hypothetical protein [Streptomyces justiciae]|uniref:Uncharacterized protein n=1 Tax=Streptomyces justiciae TaxID=2780140 RepID=A0ABU3M8K5_9ACTN|nr:hypothetical protein [Streptomyces justiciae]MDT7847249.1 hypothetical protein [Streptomyces justiciae]
MELIVETYFGWDPLSHTVDCPTPTWDDVEIRRSEGVRPVGTGAEPHGCPNDVCSHSNTFGRVQLRLLCRDCGTVRTITGEGMTEVVTHTSLTGWGQAPRRMGEVWLWPGRPAIAGGEPHQYLVTRQAAAVTRATLYGIITRYRDAEGTPRWIAGAVPDEDAAHQISMLRWRHASGGLAALEDAAAWIADTETAPQRPLVVAV